MASNVIIRPYRTPCICPTGGEVALCLRLTMLRELLLLLLFSTAVATAVELKMPLNGGGCSYYE